MVDVAKGTIAVPKSESKPRYLIIDAVRGVAIIGVVIYHLVWDLRFLQFTTTDVTFDFWWIKLAQILQIAFLSLAGASLVMAHANGFRWRAFWRRFGILAAAAIFVSVGTFIAFQEGFVYFGILHAIALFSVMALPFVRAPLWLVFVAALVVIVSPFIWQSDLFNIRVLSWIGFWTFPPYTQDLQPVFPGFGFVLGGIFVMRVALKWQARIGVLTLVASGKWFHWLVKAGRWSLVIYLVHQPILLGVLIPLANWLQPGQVQQTQVSFTQEEKAAGFYGACVGAYGSSQAAGDDQIANAIQADGYCSCAVQIMTENNLFDVVNAGDLSPQQATVFGAIPQLCQAMATAPLDIGVPVAE